MVDDDTYILGLEYPIFSLKVQSLILSVKLVKSLTTILLVILSYFIITLLYFKPTEYSSNIENS